MEKEPKSNVKKVILTAAIIVVFLLVAAVAIAYFIFKTQYYNKANYVKDDGYEVTESTESNTYVDEAGNLQEEEEATLDEDTEKDVLAQHEEALSQLSEEDLTGTYNILLIGVDRRDSSWYGNSDVMMLVTVNKDKKTIYLTSFLRDLYANIPGIGVRKLNAACANGGAELCVETIKKNYGVQIDNYAMVDFNAMIDIVDALGGIELEITDDEVRVANGYIKSMCEANGDSYAAHQFTSSGLVHMDGYQAVGYARNRYSGNTYDFGRTERQRKVIMAIFEKAKDGGLGSLNSAAQSVLPYVTHNVDEGTVLKLLLQAPGWLDYDIEEQHIPYDRMYYSKNEILIPDMKETLSKLRETLYQ